MVSTANRILNRLAGKTTNVWSLQELIVKQEANSRRMFLSTRAGHDLTQNSGRKQKSLDARGRIKLILNGYDNLSKCDLISMISKDM